MRRVVMRHAVHHVRPPDLPGECRPGRPICRILRIRRSSPLLGALGLAAALALGLQAAETPRAGWELLETGRYVEAVAAAQSALESRDDAEEWSLILGRGLLTLGRYAEAHQALTNALSRLPRSIRLRWLGREILQHNGQTDAARRLVQEIIELVAARPFAYRDPADLVAFGQAALLRGADPKQILERVFAAAKKAEPPLLEAWLAAGELALEKRDFALAARSFQEALQRFPNAPDVQFGLARAYAPSEPPLMLAALEAALARNSNHLGSLLLLAEHQVDSENYAGAEDLFERVLRLNPHHPKAWAGRALVARLQNLPQREQVAREMALRFWTNNPRVDHFIGRKLSEKYRFAEGAACQRRALALDPDYLPARAQLALDLLRLGEDAEGWRLMADVQQRDPYDVAAHNLMTLRDKLEGFATLSNAHFRVRLTAREAALYGPRALDLLERAHARLTAAYGATLERPTRVEIFADASDFAVRTFGMPEHHGFLGVCFGPVITANSPAARPGQRFNWESMLWHEFAHVVTLHLTRNRMPRWLSEGISVYEERRADPAWGERMTPVYRDMILSGELTPVANLSAAFLAPPSGRHLQFAYFQSSLVVEFLITRFGPDKLLAILRNLADGTPVHDALAQHTVPMTTFEQEFAAFARQQAEALAPALDWEKPPLALRLAGASSPAWSAWAESRTNNYWVLTRRAADLIEARQWPQARALLEQLTAAFPQDTGPDSAWRQLAAVCRALEDPAGERAAWAGLAERDDEATDAYLRLCELAADAGDWDTVRRHAERYLAVDPLVPAPWRWLARAAEGAGEAVTAATAYRALLELDPPNPAEVHFGLARALHRLGDPAARRHVLQALEEAPRYREALRLLREIHAAENPPASPDTAALHTP